MGPYLKLVPREKGEKLLRYNLGQAPSDGIGLYTEFLHSILLNQIGILIAIMKRYGDLFSSGLRTIDTIWLGIPSKNGLSGGPKAMQVLAYLELNKPIVSADRSEGLHDHILEHLLRDPLLLNIPNRVHTLD